MTTKKIDPLAELAADADAGWFASLFADEDAFDRRKLWQLGTWGAAALGALSLAFMTAQTSVTLHRELASVSDIARQNRELAGIVTQREGEARRLASAVDTLNADRDRLYARVTGIEQGLDSVTGAVKRQAAMPAPPAPAAAPPLIAAPESIAPSPSPQPRIADTPPREPVQLPATTAAIPASETEKLPEIPAGRTEFGVDIGTASSIEGLRALWRGMLAGHKDALAPLRPIVSLKERSGLGLQLRLVAGPIGDAAAAARICAALAAKDRTCEMAPFDGQRLAMGSQDADAAPAPRATVKPQQKRRVRRVAAPPAQAAPVQRPAQSSGLPSLFNRNN